MSFSNVRGLFVTALAALMVTASVAQQPDSSAGQQSGQPPSQQPSQQPGQQQTQAPNQQGTPPPPPDQTAPEAGGPGGDTGAVALPKKAKKDDVPPPPPPSPRVVNPEGMGTPSFRVDVPVVNVDVGVLLEKSHQFVPGLKPGNFRIFEDGVEQKVNGFQQQQAPITAVLLLEFASTNYYFIYDMESAASAFAQQLKPDDYVAVESFDLKTHILSDFSKDKRAVYESLRSLTIPTFRETNVFDALYSTLDRLTQVEGHKYIVLIASGRDTFSRINLDQMLKKVRTTPDVTIFAVGTGQMARELADSHGGMGSIRQLDYLQADNQMKTFASMTGGMSFFPMFQGQMPEIFHAINDSIRNQYLLSYRPTNSKMDGTYRKLRVELVDKDGKPLKMEDEKHKPMKYDIIAREGYRAKQVVE